MFAKNSLKSAQNFNFLMQNLQKQAFCFFIFLAIFDKVFSNLYGFMPILDHISAQNMMMQNSDRAKEFTFRRSGRDQAKNDQKECLKRHRQSVTD